MKRKKKLGCCGYDELAYKPPTTRPMQIGGMPAKKIQSGGFGPVQIIQVEPIVEQQSPMMGAVKLRIQ